MDDRVSELESHIESFDNQLASLGGRITKLDGELAHRPEHGGWRSLRLEIDDLKWQFVTQPMLARLAVTFLVSCLAGAVTALAIR